MSEIKAVFFDLGNVLVNYDAKIALEKFARLLETPEDQVWKIIFISDLERRYSVGKITSREFFTEASKHFSKSIDYEVFADTWNQIFWANDGMGALVDSVAKHFAIYLISNTNELHFEFIKKRFPILTRFNRCFPSHEVGYRKPDTAIFEYALRETKVLAKEAVFIDDVLEFVEAAEKVGMHAVQFRSKEQLENDLRNLEIIF